MAAEERNVMRPREHVDGVDLQDAEAIDGPKQRCACGFAPTRRVEPLRSEGYRPRFGEGEIDAISHFTMYRRGLTRLGR